MAPPCQSVTQIASKERTSIQHTKLSLIQLFTASDQNNCRCWSHIAWPLFVHAIWYWGNMIYLTTKRLKWCNVCCEITPQALPFHACMMSYTQVCQEQSFDLEVILPLTKMVTWKGYLPFVGHILWVGISSFASDSGFLSICAQKLIET